jgi:hypothetical protein
MLHSTREMVHLTCSWLIAAPRQRDGGRHARTSDHRGHRAQEISEQCRRACYGDSTNWLYRAPIVNQAWLAQLWGQFDRDRYRARIKPEYRQVCEKFLSCSDKYELRRKDPKNAQSLGHGDWRLDNMLLGERVPLPHLQLLTGRPCNGAPLRVTCPTFSNAPFPSMAGENIRTSCCGRTMLR